MKCPTPCPIQHPRCRYCGWLLLPGEQAKTVTGICRHCEQAIVGS
jgi:hypothetical protein